MAFTAEQHREHREWRAAQGLCVRCGKRAAGDDRRVCEPCVARGVQRKRERVEKWRAAGLCFRCGEAPLTGLKMCEACLEQQRTTRPSRATAGKRVRVDREPFPKRPVRRRGAGKGYGSPPELRTPEGGSERALKPVYDGRGRIIGYSVWHGGPGLSTANGSSLKMNGRR